MTFVSDVQEFDRLARSMFAANPTTCRFSVKTRNAEQRAVIKVSDDKQTITFTPSDANAVKRIEKLSRWFIEKMVEAGGSDTLLD